MPGANVPRRQDLGCVSKVEGGERGQRTSGWICGEISAAKSSGPLKSSSLMLRAMGSHQSCKRHVTKCYSDFCVETVQERRSDQRRGDHGGGGSVGGGKWKVRKAIRDIDFKT